jgi:hypothetical protein
MSTPVTQEGLEQFDHLPPLMAVALAWSYPGKYPTWHYRMQQIVRAHMPVLGRALDRLVSDLDNNKPVVGEN